MHDILQDFPVAADPSRVYRAISEPAMLDEWWTIRSSGNPSVGARYDLDFGPGYQWGAVVTKAEPGTAFELRMTDADADWLGSHVGFDLEPSPDGTQVRFYHRGWPEANSNTAFRATAGLCTSGSFGGSSSTASQCRTRSGSTCRRHCDGR